jgi:hypothetical protein
MATLEIAIHKGFVRVLVKHAQDDNPKIRKAACRLVCYLGTHSPKFYHLLTAVWGAPYLNKVAKAERSRCIY